MSRRLACAVLAAAACGAETHALAEQRQADKPAAPLVSVIGCAQRSPQGTWMLTRATEGVETPALFMTAKEIDEARKKALGTNRYLLLGTPEFLTRDELLKTGQRTEFTRPEVANATGQLQDGRKILVKGLLITTAAERRLNLVAVQQLADACQ
ncbi:MAG: hypothetical protein HYU37_06550 [Acidobacteria bacterium]|nr:hypothetical protein [Acidobacteriota bacterium]